MRSGDGSDNPANPANEGTDCAVALLDRPLGGDLGPEFAVLRLGADPELAALLPRMRFDLQDLPMVVTDIVDGRPAADLALEPEVAAALGAAIGAWHVGSARYAHRFRSAPVAWPLLFGDPLLYVSNRDDLGAPVPAAVAGDPLLRASLGALRREWAPSTVVHGDCRAANAVLTAEPNGCGGARAVLIGWGRSGLGDPAWDAGCLLADLLAAALAAGAASSAEPAMSACLAAYGRTAGAPATGFARRVALSVVARLVALAYEGADLDDPPHHHHDHDHVHVHVHDHDHDHDHHHDHDHDLLRLARSVAAWVPNWTLRFEQWLGVFAVEHDARWPMPANERRSRAMHPAGAIRQAVASAALKRASR